MKILIIGSEGFIGSNAVKFFSNKNHEVQCADIVKKVSENYFEINPDYCDFTQLFNSKQFDVCINCSGGAEVAASISNPVLDYTLNTLNVLKILEAIRIYQPECKFLNLSSAAVYGNPEYIPINEKHPVNPISPYGYHKLAAENICSEYHNIFKIACCNLRIFSAFGAGLKKQLFWDLYTKTKQTDEIKLFGTGKESRDFIYIDDLLNAIDLIIQHDNFSGSVINVANNNEIYINYAVELFYKNFNQNIKFEFTGNSKTGDPVNWKADISTLKSFGYIQKISFEEGIIKYIEWLKELN